MPLSPRHQQLSEAQNKAIRLFDEVAAREYIRPGVSEREINQQIYALALELFGIRKYWHKRIVRAGKNTLCPYRENPPDLMVQTDDVVFLDLGPVFEDWEADFGRTYVVGKDSKKHKLMHDIEKAWHQGKQHFLQVPDISGAQLYNYMYNLANDFGWTFGGEIAGHLIGQFPHEKIQGNERENYIHPENHKLMRERDPNGQARDWILEVHFVDREKQFGGFFEQLLTVD